VRVAINSGDTHNARVLRQVAGNAVRAGMSWHDAMRAITVVPAELFGMGDRYGVIAPGYGASLVLWSGDPLELSSAAERMFVDGVSVDLRSRQDVLFERYR
jgi:imidazolonepropionase-like amidohydrolase